MIGPVNDTPDILSVLDYFANTHRISFSAPLLKLEITFNKFIAFSHYLCKDSTRDMSIAYQTGNPTSIQPRCRVGMHLCKNRSPQFVIKK